MLTTRCSLLVEKETLGSGTYDALVSAYFCSAPSQGSLPAATVSTELTHRTPDLAFQGE
jgi:hypothetical protein